MHDLRSDVRKRVFCFCFDFVAILTQFSPSLSLHHRRLSYSYTLFAFIIYFFLFRTVAIDVVVNGSTQPVYGSDNDGQSRAMSLLRLFNSADI